MTARSRDVVGIALAVGIALLCLRLGVWQLARLGERRARNVAARAARARPPLEVVAGLAVDSVVNRRLSARGRYDYEHERLWRPRAYAGIPGVDVVTPLRLADGSAVLVDRGWAPSPDGYHVDEPAYREPDSASVLGIGLGTPRARGDVDARRLRDSFPYPLVPFVLQQLPAEPASGPPPPLRRWPLPELSDGPHLSYAIQWFSFALIILVGSVALFRQRHRGGARPLPPPRERAP